MDIIRLYNDYGIEYRTEGHKHTRSGWVNTECPFCTGNPGLHLGWNLKDEYFYCYRCGWKSTVKTISMLTHLQTYEVVDLLPKYGINRTIIKQVIQSKKQFQLPTHTSFLKSSHKRYLIERGFNPDKLELMWGIKGTNPVSKLGSLSYKYRIIIPFIWNGEIVSFDSRDITDEAMNKYQACPAEYETIPHKAILYGNQEEWNPNLGICVEGPTDVWRIGYQAFATSGIQYTHEQVRVMSNTFRRIAVVYDDDPQAQVQAKKLVAELKFRNVDAFNVQIKGDPGSMNEKEVRELIGFINLTKAFRK
jgi:hypothetical protein